MDTRGNISASDPPVPVPEQAGWPVSTWLGHDPRSGHPPVPVTYFSLYSEKRAGQGEDAPALAVAVGSAGCVVGAFDGLGGAGSTQIDTAQGRFSSAYLASRLARQVSWNVTSAFLSGQAPPQPKRHRDGPQRAAHPLRDRLEDEMREQLSTSLAQFGAPPSRIRGDLIRPLPTTLALGVLRMWESKPHLSTLWAGDSRVYLMLPQSGLHQLTVDDLKSRGDAMRNLHDDSPMSNLLSADGRFDIHVEDRYLPEKAIVLAATDGCFGFLRTPPHFEDLLLAAMMQTAAHSGDWEDWRAQLLRRIVEVTGDDATMAVTCIGWESFADMAQQFGNRQVKVDQMTRRIDRIADAYQSAKRAADEARIFYEEAVARLWSQYQVSYEQFITVPEDPHDAGQAPPKAAEPKEAAVGVGVGEAREPADGSTSGSTSAASAGLAASAGSAEPAESAGSIAADDDITAIADLVSERHGDPHDRKADQL